MKDYPNTINTILWRTFTDFGKLANGFDRRNCTIFSMHTRNKADFCCGKTFHKYPIARITILLHGSFHVYQSTYHLRYYCKHKFHELNFPHNFHSVKNRKEIWKYILCPIRISASGRKTTYSSELLPPTVAPFRRRVRLYELHLCEMCICVGIRIFTQYRFHSPEAAWDFISIISIHST